MTVNILNISELQMRDLKKLCIFHGSISQNDQLPVDLMVQLVEHCKYNYVKVMGSNAVQV